MEFSITGVFISMDFFLFFVFWEIVLIPMFFLIGIWGGPNRQYASIKFLIYTHVGSVIMLLSIFALFWNGSAGLNRVVYVIDARAFDMTVFLIGARTGGTFRGLLPLATQFRLLVAFFFGFAGELPIRPFPTWLPDTPLGAP